MLDFRNWGFATWLFVLIWVGLFAWGNCPLWQQHPKDRPFLDLRGYMISSAAWGTDTEYEFTGITGWPFESLWINFPSKNIYRFSPVLTILNVVTLIVTIASIAWLLQNGFRQFSIFTAFMITTLAALVCGFGGFIFSGLDLTSFHAIFRGIYFAPTAILVGYLAANRLRNRKTAIIETNAHPR